MKKHLPFFLLLFVGLLLFGACKAGKKHAGTSNEAATRSNSKLSDTGPEIKVVDEIAGYEKTPCYGQCPVFKVRFYSDGKVSWYGRMNVDRLGNYVATISPEILSDIQKKAAALEYFKLEEEYPTNYKIADLPYTITFVRFGDTIKAVRNMLDGPEKLIEFEKYLEGLIGSLDWKKVGE